MTITIPILNNAALVILIVRGEDKAIIAHQLLVDDVSASPLPLASYRNREWKNTVAYGRDSSAVAARAAQICCEALSPWIKTAVSVMVPDKC